MFKAVKEIRLDLTDTPFSLNHTLNCGQVFRWQKHGDRWHGVIRETFVKIRQKGGVLQFQTHPRDVEAAFIRSYFRLDDDLPHIYSRIMKDRHVREAVVKFRGLRLMRQDPWECLISYICATNKNIPAVKNMIKNLCARFGKKILANGEEVYTFPQPRNLAQSSLKDLRLCKLGFRAERIKKTSRLMSDSHFDLAALKTMPYEKAKKELTALPGVGPKVADCVLLFSLEKLEAFPIDIWMKRIISEFYREHFERSFVEKVKAKKSLSPHEYAIINSFGRKYFGEYVGYAQEYLFHYQRCQ